MSGVPRAERAATAAGRAARQIVSDEGGHTSVSTTQPSVVSVSFEVQRDMSFPMRAVILLEEALRQDWVWVWVLECVHEVMPLRDSVQFMPARGSDTQLRHVQRPLQRNGIQCSLCQRAARFV